MRARRPTRTSWQNPLIHDPFHTWCGPPNMTTGELRVMRCDIERHGMKNALENRKHLAIVTIFTETHQNITACSLRSSLSPPQQPLCNHRAHLCGWAGICRRPSTMPPASRRNVACCGTPRWPNGCARRAPWGAPLPLSGRLCQMGPSP
jgi:hypothetical protein